MIRTTIRLMTTLAVAVLGGCTGLEADVDFQTSDRRDQNTARVADDPIAYLRQAAAACDALSAYEVEFYRQERAGLFVKSLKEEEHSRVKFQAEPLRIRMDMLDDDSEFLAVSYVAGHNDDKLRCKWRKGAFGGDGAVSDYDPSFAVKFGRSQSPITDFGVARLLARVLDTLDTMTDQDMAPHVEYIGLTRLERTPLDAHHIRLTYDAATGLERTRVDLLIAPDTSLPAACYLWRANGDLDAKYNYIDFQPREEIPLDEFVIEEAD